MTYKGIFGKNMGTLVELMPMAVIGCEFSSLDLLLTLKNCTIFYHFIMFFIIYIIFCYDIFIHQPGFWYGQVSMNIFSSIVLFITFISFPFNDVKNNKLKFIIKILTSFTGGIYYIHTRVRDFLRKVSFFFNQRSYFSSFIIYILCYLICFIGNKIFKNYKIKYCIY